MFFKNTVIFHLLAIALSADGMLLFKGKKNKRF